MEAFSFLRDLLLFSGLFLFLAGSFFYFVPLLLIKWNEIGNLWIGAEKSARHHATFRRVLSADYAVFANHRVTGGIMWGLSSLFLIIYVLYR